MSRYKVIVLLSNDFDSCTPLRGRTLKESMNYLLWSTAFHFLTMSQFDLLSTNLSRELYCLSQLPLPLLVLLLPFELARADRLRTCASHDTPPPFVQPRLSLLGAKHASLFVPKQILRDELLAAANCCKRSIASSRFQSSFCSRAATIYHHTQCN